MSILCEVIVSVIICISVLFGKVCKMELFHCTVAKLLLKYNYVLFLISVFIVQVTKLVQFTQYNTFSKIPPSTAMHFATHVRTWRVAGLRANWLSLMLPITSIMRWSNFSRVSTFVPYTSLFIQLHKWKSKNEQYGVSEGKFGAPNPNSSTVK